MKCLECGKDFIPKRSTAKFDTPACKLKYNRKKLSQKIDKKEIPSKNISEPKKPPKDDFVPNWKRQGFKTKEEGIANIFKHLEANKQKILNAGLGEEVIFTLGDRQFVLKGKKK